MNVSKALKSMDFSQLWSLFLLCVKHPLFAWPTFKATLKTVEFCKTEFKDTHHKNGAANAFRHALWNALIVHHCIKWLNNPLRVLAWAKIITDWHEDFSPNKPLARAMDLHNNRVGRVFVAQHLKVSQKQLIQLVMKLIPLSRKLTSIEQIRDPKNASYLIHIEND